MAKGGRGGEESSSATGLLKSQKNLNSEDVRLDKENGKPMLSVCSKICYAVGGAPYQITGSAIGFFLQIYLLDVAQLDPFNSSIILFAGRAWDAVTDPTVGFFVSRSKWMKFGRLMPWIVFSTPFAVISYLLMWYVPDVSTGKVFWYLIFYCLFQTLMTCFHVPYSALTMFISSDQSERDSATAYRMTVEVLGTVLGTAIQGQIVGSANAPCLQSPETNMTLTSEEVNITQHVSIMQTRQAYMIAAGVICVTYIICAAVLFCGVREIRDPIGKCSARSIPFFRGLKLVMQHGPYVKLILGFLFTSLAFMLLEGNFALFCIYTLEFRDHFQNILLVIMLSATLMIPFWQWFLSKFGKKVACYIGISSAIPFLILIVTVKSNLIIAYAVSFAAGVSVAAAFLLSWSMLPDVIDDFNLKNPDSPGLEAIFYSFYVFFTKFASGVSLGVSTLSLDFAGYLTRGCRQPSSVDVTLRILVCPLPVALILLGLLFFKLYPIDEKARKKNKKMLEDLRGNEPDTDSDSYNEKNTHVDSYNERNTHVDLYNEKNAHVDLYIEKNTSVDLYNERNTPV